MAKQRLMNKYGGKTQFGIKTKITKKLMKIAGLCRPEDKPKAVNVYVCLPSEKQLCLNEAIKQGLVNKKTHIVAIEQDQWICQKIRKKLRLKKITGKIKSFTVINKNLLDITADQLIEAADGNSIDFCYFDTCNTLSPEYQNWVEEISGACDNEVVLMSNIMPARVVAHLADDYIDSSDYWKCLEECWSVGAIAPKNRWWGEVHQCMEDKTQLETCCIINYKEEGMGCPMTVTISSDNNFLRRSHSEWKKLLNKHVDPVQRLGYK